MDLDSPRRALLVAPADSEATVLRRSRGWASEAAALEAARMLDTDAASRQVRECAGFFELGAGEWAVLRGGLGAGAAGAPVWWREVVAFSASDLARVRFDPFRLLTTRPPVLDAAADEALPAPVVSDASAADDALRVRALQASTGAGREALALLFAAVLDATHTLVTESPWTCDDVELLLLLLPPRLRPALTFHTWATSLPRPPIPRLVLTQLEEDWPFEAAEPQWEHRLPATTADIRPRALAAARGLMDLLDAPARLTEAHEAYGRYADAVRPERVDLLREVERVVRGAAVADARDRRDAKAALLLLAQAAPAEGDVLFTMLRSTLAAGELTRALAELLVERGAPSLTSVAERFLRSPGAAADVIRALAATGAAADADAGRRVVAGVQCVRTAYRSLPAQQWESGLPVGEAMLELCRVVGSTANLAQEGGWEGDPAPLAGDAPAGARGAPPLTSQSDADIFLGFLGVDASRSRPARWELMERGPALAGEVLERTRRASRAGEDATEGVHWSFALIERVRSGQVDHEFLMLAATLLPHAAPRGAAGLLRGYLDRRPSAAAWLLEHAGLRELLGSRELAVHWAGAVGRALVEARTSGELTAVEAICQHLSRAGVQLREPQLLDTLADPLHQLGAILIESGSRRQAAARLTGLYALLSAVVAPEAGPALRRLIFEEHEASGAALLPAAREDALQSRDAPPAEQAAPARPVPAARESRADPAAREARSDPAARESRSDLAARESRSDPAARESRSDPAARESRSDPATRESRSDPAARESRSEAAARESRSDPAPGDRPPPLVIKSAPVRSRKPLLAAAGVALLAGAVLVANVLMRVQANGGGVPARGGGVGGPAPSAPTPAVSVAASSAPPRAVTRDEIAAELAEARLHARSQDWDRVVGVLQVAAPDASFPESFAYDSLLATSAVRHALTLPQEDSSRVRLLQLARQRSTRALSGAAAFTTGADELRLLRAEACIEGGLGCDENRTAQDLLLAARSASRAVSTRAADVLLRWVR